MRFSFLLSSLLLVSITSRAQSADAVQQTSGELISKIAHLAPAHVDSFIAPVEGCVGFTVMVNAQGTVALAEPTSGPVELREAERAAVLATTYRPYFQAGVARPVTSTVTRCAMFSPSGEDVAANAILLSSGVAAAQILSKPMPQFPAVARQQHVSGASVVQIVIDASGHVVHTRIVSGPQLLRDSVLDAVRQWTYQPFLLNSEPVGVIATITVIVCFGA